jgi:hypothetical protein
MPVVDDAIWDFFIAYAHSDARAAEELYGLLAEHAKTYLDARSLRLGDDWDLALRDAQLRSRVTLVLVSDHGDSAFYQREEIAAAIARARDHPSGHRVVPIYLDGTPKPTSEHVPYGLRIKHGLALSATVTYSDIADRLLELVRDLNAETGEGSPRPDVNQSDGDRETVEYGLDICFCVEASPVLSPDVSRIWAELIDLPFALTHEMLLKSKAVTEIRVCVPAASTKNGEVVWHDVPSDMGSLTAAVARATAVGTPEAHPTILDQLDSAFNGDWQSTHGIRRQIIFVWSASDPRLSENTFARMRDRWETAFDQSAKRLVLFAPNNPTWNMFSDSLDACVHHAALAGRDLSDDDRKVILRLIADSI